ncbi:MAG: SUMF1/EgtB/PvdO family nonheme iron enzyme [Planctomycetes bacterium]|nr:SUMF1/EgtB/PvdO family nonheme iron enzyme [Planctomycetota bacterium]
MGADAAGNRNEVGAILAWELAATGPEVAFRWDVPSPETTEWTRDEEGWRIRAASFDSNGVAAVRCTIAALDDPSMKAERELELDPATGNWKSAFTFSSEWSGKRVSLLLEARDNRGNPGRSAEQQRPLASIAAKRFPVAKVVPVASGGGPAPESMRLVRGNASEDGPYLFRGQPDAVENRGFTRDGISTPFSTGRLRAMSIEYRPGDIEDFYLDAHEVSIGQYLAFVQASDGYGAPECWPSRSPGSADRRVELTTRLEAALQAGQTDVPVTGVDLLEASAYAAWVSKRLPSVVEFEYAVRGGTRHYRSWSGARNGLLLSGNVYFNAGAGGRPGKREFGGDVTPEGIWCLSGNVAEWTATPTYFDEATALDKLYQFTHFRIESLRPWESPKSSVAGQFYAGGGCFDSRSADFFRIEELAVGERRANVGFRCALSGGEAEARAREADPGRFRLEFAEQ